MQTIQRRFWAKVRYQEKGCWPWLASLINTGYGKFWIDAHWVLAHRFAYELLVGAIPEGLTLDHLCRNRSCVNPNHLEPVTKQVNILRGVGVASRNSIKTHCPAGHPYAGSNLVITGHERRCRACLKQHRHESYVRNKRGDNQVA